MSYVENVMSKWRNLSYLTKEKNSMTLDTGETNNSTVIVLQNSWRNNMSQELVIFIVLFTQIVSGLVKFLCIVSIALSLRKLARKL